MKTSEYILKTSDNVDIQVYEWLPDESVSIKKIVQIVHGMAEHCARYEDFAKFLTSNQIAVYGHDHRGHGKTAGKLEKLGFLANHNGWERLVSDICMVGSHIKEKHKDLPFYILGHSMGSFALRTLIVDPKIKINGAIISATGGDPGLLGNLGILITKIIRLFYPANSPSLLMDKLSFGAFNRAFKPNRTKFDWLSRDNNQVDKYIADPFCGVISSVSLFTDLLKGVLYVSSQKNMNKVAEDLAVLIFSGDKDPVGNKGKGPTEVYNKFKKAGIKNITLKLFADGRHEMLNEINKDEVYQFVLEWINKN